MADCAHAIDRSPGGQQRRFAARNSHTKLTSVEKQESHQLQISRNNIISNMPRRFYGRQAMEAKSAIVWYTMLRQQGGMPEQKSRTVLLSLSKEALGERRDLHCKDFD